MMYRFVDRVARGFAVLGGCVLTGLIILTCLSILGRSINTILYSDGVQALMPTLADALLATGVGSVKGAFELVEAGMAFVIFAFLPLCQLHGAHASVDIFTSKLPTSVTTALRVITEAVFAAVLVVIAYELSQGMFSKLRSGQTSFILQFPVWWPYAFSLIAAVASALVGVYVALMRLAEWVTGHVILLPTAEADQ